MGLNAAARLKKAGADIKKTDVVRFALASLRVVTTGPAKHPRSHLPVSRELVEVIKRDGIPRERFTVREDGDLGEVIDGARRTKAGLVAEQELQRDAPRVWPLEGPFRGADDAGRLYVEAEVVTCSDLDLVLRRLDANVNRGLPDSASVLASIVGSIVAINKGEPDAALTARIVEAMPQGVTAGVVAALSRWSDLAPELQARFDGGAPIGLLVPVLAARSEDRAALLDKLIAAGVRSAKGATRRANKAKAASDPWARRMTPRQLLHVADTLGDGTTKARTFDAGVREGLEQGLRLAANQDVVGVLDLLPASLAEAIREAREGTVRRGPEKV